MVLFSLLLLLWAAPARAEFALGVASSNVLIRSEADALRLSAYLEDRVGEAVTVRVLADEKGLHRWMSRYRQVDLGVFGTEYLLGQPTGEFHRLAVISGAARPSQMVMRQGLPSPRVEAVKAILLAMADEPEGAALLSSLGGLRFLTAPAEQAPSRRKPTPPRRETVARKVAPAPSPVVPAPIARSWAVTAPTVPGKSEEKVTFGVTAVNSLLSSEAEARRLGSYLAARLDDGLPGPEEIVAGRSLGRKVAERMRRILLGMDDDPEGKALLDELGKVRFVTPQAELENPEPSIPLRRKKVEAPRPAASPPAIPEEGIRAEMEGR